MGTVPAPIGTVWEILTDGPTLGHLVHFGMWSEFDRRTARVGTELKGVHPTAPPGKAGFSRYILAWEPPTRFIVGLQPLPDTWVWDFSLRPQGAETLVEYRCRYRTKRWWEKVADRVAAKLSGESSSNDDLQQITDPVIDRLRDECEKRRRFGSKT